MNQKHPIVIAGPCVAESEELLRKCCEHLLKIQDSLSKKNFPFDFVFKASFDKANRSSIAGYRGPGLEKTMQWFVNLKKQFKGLRILTDIHETVQVEAVAEVCDVLQIPAFLCCQTDLIVAAI